MFPKVSVFKRINCADQDFNEMYGGFKVLFGYSNKRNRNRHHVDENGKRSKLTLTQLSYMHETGGWNFPARPFIKPALEAVNAVPQIVSLVRKNPKLKKQEMEALVNGIVENCKQYVLSGYVTPTLSKQTVKKKRKHKVHGKNATTPLVFGEDLINHFDGWVVDWTKRRK